MTQIENFYLNGKSALITQRSRVQIPPPLPGSAGHRPDCQTAVGPFDRLLAVRWRDGTPERGTLRGGSADIGIPSGCQCPPFERSSSGTVSGRQLRTVLVRAATAGRRRSS